jgi:hypothetical protein
MPSKESSASAESLGASGRAARNSGRSASIASTDESRTSLTRRLARRANASAARRGTSVWGMAAGAARTVSGS